MIFVEYKKDTCRLNYGNSENIFNDIIEALEKLKQYYKRCSSIWYHF